METATQSQEHTQPSTADTTINENKDTKVYDFAELIEGLSDQDPFSKIILTI